MMWLLDTNAWIAYLEREPNPVKNKIANLPESSIIRAYLAKQGTPIGPYDLQIAAIAKAHDLTVVTHNTREFSRVIGLRLEDWELLA